MIYYIYMLIGISVTVSVLSLGKMYAVMRQPPHPVIDKIKRVR